MLLDADVQAGIVVDRSGAVEGLVTADMIAERMRMAPREASAAGNGVQGAALPAQGEAPRPVGRRNRAGSS